MSRSMDDFHRGASSFSQAQDVKRHGYSVPYDSEDTRSEGFDEYFDPPLEPKYECPICLLGLKNPVQTPCGHRFCKNCISRSIRDAGPKCPVDNEPLTQQEINLTVTSESDDESSDFSELYPDNFAKREMMSFPVWCRLKKERGCPWKGPMNDLMKHLEECPYADVKCPNECGEKTILQKDLEKHLKETCKKRKVKCEYCGNTVFYSEIERHKELCPKVPLTCEKCQQKNIPREKITDHHEKDCPKVKSKCPLAFLGCTFEDFNPAVAKHVAENHVRHLSELATYVKNLPSGDVSSSYQSTGVSYMPSTSRSLMPSASRSLMPSSIGPQEHTPREADLLMETTSRSASMQKEVDMVRIIGTEHGQYIAMLDRKVEDMKLRYERQLAELTHKLLKVETREIELEGRVCAGTFIWKIDNFRQCREEAIAGMMAAVHSPPFYTSLYGYKMCLRMNLNGVDSGLGRHISLFVHMMQGDWDDILEWPFTGRITLAILDQSENVEFRRPISETLVAKPNLLAFQKPTTPRNHKGYGYVEFCQIDQLRDGQYVKNNSVLVRIQVFH